MSRREVLFIADDFGMSESINGAIMRAHTDGRLDGASLMMGQAATDEAVEWARHHPTFRVGLHFHLNDSTPCTIDAWPWNERPAQAGWAIGLLASSRRLARSEIRRQWEIFEKTGLACHFVNTHHHLHVHPHVYSALLETIGRDFTGWVRMGDVRFFRRTPSKRLQALLASLAMARRRSTCPLRVSDTLWGVDRFQRMDAWEISRAARFLGDGLHEFMFHPRRERDDRDTQCLLELRQFFC